ncbi:MAG: hypothetical protein KBT27_09150 [Prevotellaceae bacterium]|nr:hypothetical protein [Candidatus Faecinaster equi]
MEKKLMIILQVAEGVSAERCEDAYKELYRQGMSGLMLLPYWVKLLAITDDDAENIKILPKDDDI